MADRPFPWRRTFILGFRFFGINIVWPLFNSFIPPMLEDLGLAAAVIGFKPYAMSSQPAKQIFTGVYEKRRKKVSGLGPAGVSIAAGFDSWCREGKE